MNKRTLAALVFGLVALVGCNRATDNYTYRTVTIAPEIVSRVSGLYFEKGDQVGLTITTADGYIYTENTPMSYNGSAFTPDDGLIWYNDLNTTSTLSAYYPYNSQGAPAEFSIQTNQSAGLESSDLLAAVKKDVTPTSSAVAMTFYHLLSQLAIHVDNQSDGTITNITLKGAVPTATINFATPSATAESGAAAADITPCTITPDKEYMAILVPQEVALEVKVDTDDGKSRSKHLVATSLAGGYKYDVSITVTNIDIALSLSGEITDWKDGGSITGDASASSNNPTGNLSSGNPATSTTLEYDGETYATVTLGDKIWMAENLRYMPAGATIEEGVWYPDGGETLVATLGLLYNYETAMAGATTEPARGICPEGWHLPSKAELEALVAANPAEDFFDKAGSVTAAGTYKDDSYLMSSTESESNNTLCYVLCTSNTEPATQTLNTGVRASVRCVKD